MTRTNQSRSLIIVVDAIREAQVAALRGTFAIVIEDGDRVLVGVPDGEYDDPIEDAAGTACVDITDTLTWLADGEPGVDYDAEYTDPRDPCGDVMTRLGLEPASGVSSRCYFTRGYLA